DVDENRVIDPAELALIAPAWRTRPSADQIEALGGPPRLGYAVDPQGRVFLRWALPVSPYSATVQILRQPAPAASLPTPRPGVGIIAEVDPIYDDATAIPLLGDHWPTLQTAFTYTLQTAFTYTVDADGVAQPYTLTTVAEMHGYIQDGTNPFAGQQLANEDPGVARVLGKGYLDSDFSATGTYTYWVRVRGRVLGPLVIDTTQPTQLPAPANVQAFEGTANTDGAPDTWELQSELRVAHAAVFLTWNPHLPRRQNHPEWAVGFNVFRKECGLGGNNCTDYRRINEEPVFPQALPISATLPETVTYASLPGVALRYGTEMQEFTYFWADRDLNTDRLYCYRIAARDLLGQNGQPSAETPESCLRPPDYLPPPQPVIDEATPVYDGCKPRAIRVRFADESAQGAVGYELWRSDRATRPWHPQFWALRDQSSPDVPASSQQLVDDASDVGGLQEHDMYWYRVVSIDKHGNRSAPSAPLYAAVDDICAPAPPVCPIAPPGQTAICDRWVFLDDTAVVNVYRKFSKDDLPLLVDRVRIENWDWYTWQDEYVPPHETDFFYEVRAEDEVGNLSEPSFTLTRTLGIGLGGPLGTPIITGTVMTKVGGDYHATIWWAASGGSNLREFKIYRSQGESAPASVAEMSQIDTVPVEGGSATPQTYSYVNNVSLSPNEIYWYAVAASGPFSADAPSEPYATRYIELGPEAARVISPLGMDVELVAEGVQITVYSDYCCFVILRSRTGSGDFTQITPVIHSGSYLDRDVRAGEPAFYQALRIDAGALDGPNIDWNNATGEILAASAVIQAPIPSLPALPPPNPQAPPPPSPLPPSAPNVLHFGPNWTVQVRSYDAGSTPADASGDGAVLLEVAPGDFRPTWVQFDHIQFDANGNVLAVNPGGNVQVMINAGMVVQFPDRLTYLLNNLTLDQNGGVADVALVGYGPGLTRWDMSGGGAGEPKAAVQAGVRIANPSLQWTQPVTPPADHDCTQPDDTLTFLFAVTDWPLLIVPTQPFTVTESGINFGATCTLYRDRFSGEKRPGEPIPANLIRDARNDYFLQLSYTASSATYTVVDGLSGAWSSSGDHSHRTAWPYGFKITSAARAFALTNGRLGEGTVSNGSLQFDYATTIDPTQVASYNGTFSELTLGNNGAIYGQITGDSVNWTAFTIDEPQYSLYVPAALTPATPDSSWTVVRGHPASGVPGDGRNNPGLNARERALHWLLCPTIGAPMNLLTFPANAQSKLDLYIRRSGVSGRADMTPDSEVAGPVSGYDTRFTRFAQSWLSNLPLQSGIAGRILLPYPSDVEFNFAALLLDQNGCVDKGDVLPNEEILAYWQIGLLPLAVDFRTAAIGPTGPVEKLWVLGEYTINNLARVDGGEQDPAVEIDVAFNPNGTFYDSDIFVQDTVYYVDGFYTVMSDLRLSDYDVNNPANSENPAWDASITIQPPPANVDGFVELTAGVYVPWFGSVTDANNDHIFLLGGGTYVGFDQRPHAAQPLSADLPIEYAYDLAYAQVNPAGGAPSRWVGIAKVTAWDLLIMDLPHSIVIEPAEQRHFYGFPAAAAVMQAVHEAYLSWGTESTPRATLFAGWRDELEISGAVFDTQVNDAVAILDNVNVQSYKNLLDAINNAAGSTEDSISTWLTDAGVSVATREQRIPIFDEVLTNSPLQIKWPRGATFATTEFDDDGRPVGMYKDLIELDAYVKLYTKEQSATGSDADWSVLLRGALEINLDPQGEIYVGATGIQAAVLDKETTMDVEFVLYFADPYGLEGRLALYDFETEVATIDYASAVGGFTVESGQIELLYVGANLDMQMDMEVIGRINVGGSMLFGRLDPTSQILQTDYSDLFDDLDTSALAPGEVIQGAYMMVYANNIPLWKYGAGCVGFEINGGGEVAFWVFTRDGGGDTAWGTRLGVNANGKAFCVASLAAAVTLQLDNDFGQNNLDLSGDAWAGAGCGGCEPETWITETGFEDDKWCLKCKIEMEFLIPLKGSQSKSEFEADFSCPF
ncbi:MAG: hypothetical protein DCC57_12095, partial [Chloroflexi bacterium]